MTEHDYRLLTKTWEGPHGAAWNATAEFCIEEGWMDHFGIITPKGYKAIEQFEEQYTPYMVL